MEKKKEKIEFSRTKKWKETSPFIFEARLFLLSKKERPTICKKRILVSKEKRNCSFWEREEENISSCITELSPIIILKLGFHSIILTLTLNQISRHKFLFLSSDRSLTFLCPQIIFFFHFCFVSGASSLIRFPGTNFSSFPLIVLRLSFVPKSFYFCISVLFQVLVLRSDFQVRISLPFLRSLLDFPLSLNHFLFSFLFCFRCKFSVFIFALKLFPKKIKKVGSSHI